MKQKMMRRVIYSLVPLIIVGIYFYGWRVLVLLTLVTLTACFTEWIFVRKTTNKISEAVIVTSILFTLILPPKVPYFVAILGIIFGVLFGKMVFGGFGKNPFNPALVGRAFIYVNFVNVMTVEWVNPSEMILGNLTRYSVDTITHVTPMLNYRATGEMLDYFRVLIGNISGSIGETSAVLIILSGIYLIYTKTASKEIIFSVILSFLTLTSILHYTGYSEVPNPLYALLTGGILFGAVFMATDPISAPRNKKAKYIYGSIIGIVTVIIRGFALFAGGMMFAILIGNTFAPIIDEIVSKYNASKKLKERSENG